MMSSVIPARLEFQCGHAALVSLPRVKGESSAQRTDRIAREKSAAQARSCDFCPPMEVAEVVQSVVVVAAQPALAPAPAPAELTVQPAGRPVAPVAPVVPVVPVTQPVAPAALPVAPVALPVAPVVPPMARVDVPVAPVAQPVPPVAVRNRAAPATTPLARPRRSSALAAPARNGNGTGNGTAARYRFVVRFRTEAVLNATDIRDALRQAESLGAAEVLALSRSA